MEAPRRKLIADPLVIDGTNYMTWAIDMKTYLKAKGISHVIFDFVPTNPTAPESSTQSHATEKITAQDSAKALLYLRQHLVEDLKFEYNFIEDPNDLWLKLRERFEYQRITCLPTAEFDWDHLQVQDFPSVAAYSNALHRITAQLRSCNKPVTDAEMINKTLSTFHSSEHLLAQQYKNMHFDKYSELIAAMFMGESHHEILLKNYNLRPVGSIPIQTRNVGKHRHKARGRGRGREQDQSLQHGHGRKTYKWNSQYNHLKNDPSQLHISQPY